MQYRLLGKTGVEVSSLTLGTMMFGGQTSEKDSTEIIHKALDYGINSIDTANIYNAGESENVLGKALSGKRDQAFLFATNQKEPAAFRALRRHPSILRSGVHRAR